MYRPFQKRYLYYHKDLLDRPGRFGKYLNPEIENRIICFSSRTQKRSFHCLATSVIPDLHFVGDTQCLPLYVVSEGGNQSCNVTKWALSEFRSHYRDKTINEVAIFNYVYAVLHDPEYRSRFAESLKRELPRVPFAKDFLGYEKAGRELIELHAKYEGQKGFKLKETYGVDGKIDWRVEKMRLSKDKSTLTYNGSLSLAGIPPKTYEYRLGHQSALEWVVEQFRVLRDDDGKIENDPNREDDPEYIYRLIGQVITVSLETVEIVKSLPGLGLPAVEKAASVQ